MRGCEFEDGADCIAVGGMAGQSEGDPMIAGLIARGLAVGAWCLIVKHVRGTAIGADDGVDTAIVVEIAERKAATHP